MVYKTLRCEVFCNEELPCIRSFLSIELTEKHGFTQQEAADKLFITQPAIAFYRSKQRGKNCSILYGYGGLTDRLIKLAERIAKNKVGEKELNKEYCLICQDLANLHSLPALFLENPKKEI